MSDAEEVKKPRHRSPDREVLLPVGDSVRKFSVWYYYYRVPFVEWIHGGAEHKGQPKYLVRIKDTKQRGPFDYTNTGGACMCVLRDASFDETVPNSERTWFGFSLCSMSEKFNKRKGRIIAFNRALSAYSEYDSQIEAPLVYYPIANNVVNNVVRTFLS